jgi:hypothetical protein
MPGSPPGPRGSGRRRAPVAMVRTPRTAVLVAPMVLVDGLVGRPLGDGGPGARSGRRDYLGLPRARRISTSPGWLYVSGGAPATDAVVAAGRPDERRLAGATATALTTLADRVSTREG